MIGGGAIFFSLAQQPNSGLIVDDQLVAETATYTTDEYPYSQRGSNPRSQQPSGFRPAAYTARPPASAGGAPIIIFINEITARSQNTDTECDLLSEEQNPIRRNRQQILVFCAFWGTTAPRILHHWQVGR